MASVQQVQGVNHLNHKENAAINEVMKEAQALLANNDEKVRKLATVAGAMKNRQVPPIKLHKTHNWFGDFVAKPPATIGGEGCGEFVHRATDFKDIPGGCPGPVIIGSKAAVIYGHYDKALPQLGWLLAWHKSESTAEHKVYVEAGLLEVLEKKEWSKIEERLDASGNVSRYVDPLTGAEAAAKIKDEGDKLALLGAHFGHLALPLKESPL